MDQVKETEVQVQEGNEFVITRSKGFSYITYLKIVSKVVFGDGAVAIETAKKWFYFIKGKPKSINVDYNAIASVELKTAFAFWDLLFSMIFLIMFVSSHEIWWLVLIAVFIFCSFGKNIVISRNNGPKIIIPADGIGSDNELIKNICGFFEKKVPGITNPGLENKPQGLKVLDVLPFKTLVEGKFSPGTIESNPTLKKMVPYAYANVIGLSLIAVIVIIGILAAGPSTASLEKEVWAAIEEQQDIQITDLKLIKIEKGIYTGVVTAKTFIGGTRDLNVTVVTDGRNIQWELNY
jgi:hypothetical protein